MYGEKLWTLVPPKDAVFSNMPSKRFWDEGGASRSAAARRCVQQAGDLLLVPDNWGHTTYNTRTSVGLAQEVAARLHSPWRQAAERGEWRPPDPR